MKTSLLFVALLATVALAQEPRPGDWKIQAQLTAVVLPEKLALELMEEFDDETKSTKAWEKTMAAVKRGEAELAGQLTTRTIADGTRKAKSTKEVRYRIEYRDFAFDVDSPKQVRAIPKNTRSIPFFPILFQTQEVGLTIATSAEATADGQFITLHAEISHSRFLGWEEFVAGMTPQGVKITFQQPTFSNLTNTGQYVLKSGERVLAGVHQLPDSLHRWELFIVKAWTTRTPRAPVAK